LQTHLLQNREITYILQNIRNKTTRHYIQRQSQSRRRR